MGILILFVGSPLIMSTHRLFQYQNQLQRLRMLSDHQPQKQNRSPQKRIKQKNQKELKSVQQLCTALHIYGVKLSSHLQKQLFERNSNLIKLIDGQKDKDSSAENKRLRVKLNDCQFQIKKMSQDFAQYKLLAKMEQQKVVNKLRQELQLQRSKNVEDNKKWLNYFEERSNKYEEQCALFKATTQQFYRSQQQKEISELRQEFAVRFHKICKQKELLQISNKQNLQAIHQRYNYLLQNKDEACKTKIQAMNLQLKKAIQNYEEKYEQKVSIIQLKKQEETKKIEQQKKENFKAKDIFLCQIGKIQRQKKTLSQNYDQMQINYKVMAKRFQDKQRQVEQLKMQFKTQISALQQSKKNEESRLTSKHDQQKLQILKSQYAKMQKCQQKLLKLSQIKESTVQNYKAMLKAIEVKFHKRQSKKQDVEAIKSYQEQLQYKQRQNNHIYEQLKVVRLQKENNDKIYTKIFTANSKRSGSQKIKDINSLFKTSNTTDIRHLLNISRK